MVQHHGINWWHLGSEYKDSPALGWLFITFFIFVFLIIKAVKKPLSLYLETRSKDIAKQILEAKKIKEESQKKLKEYDEKLLSLNNEILKMKEDFKKIYEEEKKELQRVALEQKEKILLDTESAIKINYIRLKNKLAKELIEKVINEARVQVLEEPSRFDTHLRLKLFEKAKKIRVES